MSARLRPISPTDPVFLAALTAAALPIADLGGAGQRVFALTEAGSDLAFGGWEGEGAERLMRSIVVPAGLRRRGHAGRLVAALIAAAAEDGARRLWLLTTDASAVFEASGFVRTPRAEAPAEILAHPQFAGLCPASAVCLRRDLVAGDPPVPARP